MKSHEQKVAEAKLRQGAYDALTTQQKLERATGKRQVARLTARLKEEKA